MELLLTSIVITLAIKHFWEKGKREYAHTRDSQATKIARDHPGWSPRKVQRHAKRRARGYWWDQIRNGFPDLKDAYEEDRLVAEEEHVKASLEGEKRRRELRDRIRAAVEEAHRLREEEREAEDARRAAATDPARPAPATPATEPADTTPTSPETAPAPAPIPDPAGSEPRPTAPTPEPIPADPAADPSEPAAAPWPGPSPTIRLVPPVQDSPDPSTEPEQEKPMTGAPGVQTNLDYLDHEDREQRDRRTAEFAGRHAPSPTSPMGDAHGYEQILAAFTADVERRGAALDSATALVARLEDADASYEQQMGLLRSLNADDETIADVARMREANEQQIATARQQATAAHDGLTTATAARDNWVARHGAVYETKAATGARGDEALYT